MKIEITGKISGPIIPTAKMKSGMFGVIVADELCDPDRESECLGNAAYCHGTRPDGGPLRIMDLARPGYLLCDVNEMQVQLPDVGESITITRTE